MLMTRIVWMAVLLVCAVSPAMGQTDASQAGDGCGRYQLYEFTVDKEPVQFLLDTRTGKIWMLRSDASAKNKFVGLNVEGVAFSTADKDIGALDKQIGTWHMNGFIDKSVKGVAERISSAFSYAPDVEKAEDIYYTLKNKSK